MSKTDLRRYPAETWNRTLMQITLMYMAQYR